MPDMSLPWWMGPSKAPWEAMLEGVQAGSSIRSNQLRTKQLAHDIQQAEHSNQLREKQMDASIVSNQLSHAAEQQRIDLAVRAQTQKIATETMQGTGLSELNQFLATATAQDKLADPATEAEFFKITSRWAPYIPQSAVNSIYDNTFKAAKDRKAMADRLSRSANPPAIVATDRAAADLLTQADELEETDPDGATSLRQRAEGIRNAARLTPTTSGPPEVGETDLPDGSKMMYYRDSKGGLKIIKPPKDNMSDLERVEYTTELRALQAKYADGDLKAAEFDKQRDALHKKFQGKKSTHGAVDPNNPLGLDLNLKQ